MPLPSVFKPFHEKGEKLLRTGKVKEVEFSGETYQVKVMDEKNPQGVWSFLQFDKVNRLKDAFCSCAESEEVAACPHLAAAYLYIFNKSRQPLHKRFEKSLWNKLCYLCAEQMKFEEVKFRPSSKGIYTIYANRQQIFLVHSTTKATADQLKHLLFNRYKETEETSLKFSNLSPEEIRRWKEGRPSPMLSYALSFWNDLAKWLMSLQEAEETYQIDFSYTPQGIPNYISVKFPTLHCKFYIPQTHLPSIIPALATVHSPLRLYPLKADPNIKITYDKAHACFLIDSNKIPPPIARSPSLFQSFQFGSWLLVPFKGFYPLNPLGLLSSKVISQAHLAQVLDENLAFIKEHLQGCVIHEGIFKVSYAIAFDEQWNLHIQGYVHCPGDLSKPMSQLFDSWAYLEEEGFYKLEGLRFKEAKTLVSAEKVGEFVQQHRTWLNTHKGFETHVASLEALLNYKMDKEKGLLSFQRTVATHEQTLKSKDFGPWIYIETQGFYAKNTLPVSLPLRPGSFLNPDQIPMFIRDNREELKVVPGFFSEKQPIVHAGIVIKLAKDEHILVIPTYDLLPEYTLEEVYFFDEFTYVEGEGFAELPLTCRLPLAYQKVVEIKPEHHLFFLEHELKNLKPFIKSLDPRLEPPKELELTASAISKSDFNTRGWYTVNLEYTSTEGAVPIAELWTASKKNQRFKFTEAGLIDFEDKRYDWLKLLAKKRLDKRHNLLTLSTIELIRLNALDPIKEGKKEKNYNHSSSFNLLKELIEFKIPAEPNTLGLSCDLRSYQQKGLHWLWFLYQQGLSGLLCDDMGLGKTHQAMALIASIINHGEKQKQKGNSYFLIICPTSVIYHWQDKLAQYLPKLRVSTFYGAHRSLDEFQQHYDILLTSYGVWRIEHQLLSKISFELAIFDEIQIAKNYRSRLYATLAHVNAHMRLGLTGTPIENHLRELKSLFDLVLPTYMPGEKDYREYFVKPIDKKQDLKRKALLSRLINPFVLRRKKENVLNDLPEKTEEISHCGLTESQAILYNNVVEQSRQVVLDKLTQRSQPIPYLHIFAILSYLKQICDHPACYLKTPSEYKLYQAGKWDLFIELLKEARESHQKVVVFSQYLNMLDIIQKYLEERHIGFAAIRGSTINRGEQLKRFNEDPQCEVFLGSLQAAGLGVELTAASVVIHYDRWWNAARENQATDRVHRSGQTRGVQVFKLVTKGTFEEKIDKMITRKGKLMEDIVGVDDHRLLKQFNHDEIIELLQNVTPTSLQEN
ncbi:MULTISPECIES: DEAD/DEAH box helicase [unclassified Neochlamydia]|uniref:DEAD/DEAH box helicase n=1 Tax=unclassified Neochlamydia TaxID=2643326 RepID=UPI001BC9007A|nr:MULTISPECIES: DEAD/DEAH box helicase [unclassified Neochlamydia]MBS4166591.1 Uncharacterized protein [Neochlamydia sp. AcF65]MBS4170447.1 Uncharacterized protein [Neochlamydia sp. AcF95]